MRGFLRRRLAAIVCLAVAGAVAVGAVIDHRNKQARVDRAELAEWYCAHLGTRCGGPSSAAIERHWNERQLAYEAVLVALGGLGLVEIAVPGRLSARRLARRRD